MRGEKVALRARQESDAPVLIAELYNDVVTRSRGDNRPWRPVALESPDSPFAPRPAVDTFVPFSAVELATGELAGEALLWNIDTHNRSAHLGLALRPAFRGRGLGLDIVRVLCAYGFTVRGLHRLQIETMADNEAMLKAATRAGFTVEGTRRGAGWVYGRFLDEVVLGLLDHEWQPAATEGG